MATNPTTGLYDLTGGDTSAAATQGINDNFTTLWLRDEQIKATVDRLNDYVVEEGFESSIDHDYPHDQGNWYYRIWNSGFYEAWYSTGEITIASGDIFELDDFYAYKTGNVPYPERIVEYEAASASAHQAAALKPTENANLVCTAGAIYGCESSGNGINSLTKSASYTVLRQKFLHGSSSPVTNPLLGKKVDFYLYIYRRSGYWNSDLSE